MIKTEIICHKIKIEHGKIGEKAVLKITDKNGAWRRLETSKITNITRNCSGMTAIETAHTIYRTYEEEK